MSFADFRRAGSLPTLLGALAHFDISFMCWVLLGALGVFISEDLGLSDAQKGLMVAVPLLSGAAFRIVLGVLGDRLGPRRVGMASMAVVMLPLLVGWLWATSFTGVLAVGLLLGVAGASFAISLPLASRSYPARYQGVVMGVAGAGNSGTVIAALAGPRLAEAYGWHAVFGLALIPVALVLLAFAFFVQEPQRPQQPASLDAFRRILGDADARRLCGFYLVTFGSYVGFASFLPLFFHDRYGLTKVDAATLAAVCAATGSLLRPAGGLLADRLGGERVLNLVFAGSAVLLASLAASPSFTAAAVLFPVLLGVLGVGNGSVFQLVGVRFGDRIGVVTGVIGAAGGLGGFLLPIAIGTLKQTTGGYAAGLAIVAAASMLSLVALEVYRRAWSDFSTDVRLAAETSA